MIGPRLLAGTAAVAGLALLGGAGAAAFNRFHALDFKPMLGGGLLAATLLLAAGGTAALLLAARAARRPEPFGPLAGALTRRGVILGAGGVVLLVLALLPIPAIRGRITSLAILGGLATLLAAPLAVAPGRTAPLAARALRSGAARGLILACWNVLAILVGLEVGVRLLDPLLTPKGGFVAGAGRRLRLEPHHPIRGSLGRSNALGYNDTEWAEAKPAGTFRIAVLGDSFAYGMVGYDANFLTLLEPRLAAPGKAVEVLNLGICAAEPGDYLDVLRTDALRFAPDLVLVSVFVGNDFDTQAARDRFVVAGVLAEADPVWNPFHAILDKERWHLYHLARTRLAARTAVKQAPVDGAIPEGGTFSEESYAHVQRRRIMFFLREGKGPLDRGFASAAQNLEAIVAEARARGAAIALAICPDECQVDPGALARSLELAKVAREDLDLDRPQRLLAAWGRERGVPVIDLLPGFRAAGAHERHYLVRDSHWNEAGNRLAADLVARGLRELVP